MGSPSHDKCGATHYQPESPGLWDLVGTWAPGLPSTLPTQLFNSIFLEVEKNLSRMRELALPKFLLKPHQSHEENTQLIRFGGVCSLTSHCHSDLHPIILRRTLRSFTNHLVVIYVTAVMVQMLTVGLTRQASQRRYHSWQA